MQKIYIVEDDKNIAEIEQFALKNAGYSVEIFKNAKDFEEKIKAEYPDLVILDVMLPDRGGLSILRDLRTGAGTAKIPIIMVTAKTTEMDKVKGLDQGADDYITKPFSLSVLRARVNTQLRKQASNHKNAPFHMDLFHFDFEAMTFYVGDSKVELSKTEQKLLRLLVENRGRTMTRGDLVDRIWTDGAEYVDENALSVTIKRLRDKLGAQKYIKTVYGIGYSWVTKDE